MRAICYWWIEDRSCVGRLDIGPLPDHSLSPFESVIKIVAAMKCGLVITGYLVTQLRWCQNVTSLVKNVSKLSTLTEKCSSNCSRYLHMLTFDYWLTEPMWGIDLLIESERMCFSLSNLNNEACRLIFVDKALATPFIEEWCHRGRFDV